MSIQPYLQSAALYGIIKQEYLLVFTNPSGDTADDCMLEETKLNSFITYVIICVTS